MPSAQQQERRLKILACRQVYTGRNQLGQQFVVYEVEAAKEDGALVKEKLRSFEPLPIGQLVEVVISPFVSERYGRSFTLQLKGDRSSSPEGAMRELKELSEAVGKLTERVRELEVRLGEVMRDDARYTDPRSPPTDGRAW